jgi:hypothetical protein
MADGLPRKGESRERKVWWSDQSPYRRRRGHLHPIARKKRRTLGTPAPALHNLVWDWVWVALGWPKGGPSVAQGPRERRARVKQKKWLCLQQKVGKGRAGWARTRLSPVSRVIADIAVIGRSPKKLGIGKRQDLTADLR